MYMGENLMKVYKTALASVCSAPPWNKGMVEVGPVIFDGQHQFVLVTLGPLGRSELPLFSAGPLALNDSTARNDPWCLAWSATNTELIANLLAAMPVWIGGTNVKDCPDNPLGVYAKALAPDAWQQLHTLFGASCFSAEADFQFAQRSMEKASFGDTYTFHVFHGTVDQNWNGRKVLPGDSKICESAWWGGKELWPGNCEDGLGGPTDKRLYTYQSSEGGAKLCVAQGIHQVGGFLIPLAKFREWHAFMRENLGFRARLTAQVRKWRAQREK